MKHPDKTMRFSLYIERGSFVNVLNFKNII